LILTSDNTVNEVRDQGAIGAEPGASSIGVEQAGSTFTVFYYLSEEVDFSHRFNIL